MDETAHKVVIIHAYLLLGLLAAIVLASILSAWSVGREPKSTSLLHEAIAAVRLLVVRLVLVPELLLCREARQNRHDVQCLRASSTDAIMWNGICALVVDTHKEHVPQVLDPSCLESFCALPLGDSIRHAHRTIASEVP